MSNLQINNLTLKNSEFYDDSKYSKIDMRCHLAMSTFFITFFQYPKETPDSNCVSGV